MSAPALKALPQTDDAADARLSRAGGEPRRQPSAHVRWHRLGQHAASVLAIVVLAVLIWRANPAVLWSRLASANLWLLAAAMALNFGQIWFKALRLGMLLSPTTRIPLRRLFGYTLIGYAGNNVLPVRGGEVVRLRLLQQREHVPVGTFVGVFSAERILDAASVLAVAGTLPLLAPLPAAARAGLALLAGVAIGGYAVLLALAHGPSVPPDAGRFRRFVGDLARGVHVVRRPMLLVRALAASLGALGWEVLIVLLVMHGFGMPLEAAAPGLVILCVNLALVAPSVPAHVGSFEAGAVLGLTLCGIGEAPALAFALAYHVVHLVPVTIAGAIAYARLPAGERTAPARLVVMTSREEDV